MLVIRCKNCGKNLEEHPTKTRCCQCPNLTSIRGGNITANDLSLVEIVTGYAKQKSSSLSREDIAWQESRKQRKIKRLDFEVK